MTRKFDLEGDDEVAPLALFLALGHAETRVALFGAGLGRTRARDGQLTSVDGRHGPLPPRERFLQIQFDGRSQIVAFALEDGMLFLRRESVDFNGLLKGKCATEGMYLATGRGTR